MTLPADLERSVADALGDEVRGAERVGGGSINQAWRVELGDAGPAFVKSRPDATAAEFEAEAVGLGWLAEAGGVAVPEVVGRGTEPAWLALEWIEPGDGGSEEELGAELARLHLAGASAHGKLPPSSPDDLLRIGPLELPTAGEGGETWAAQYAGSRLLPLLAMARDRGAISGADAAAIESVCARIDGLGGPAEPPARLHGDLWAGNVLAASGRHLVIDPAAHGGHRETDLAMLRLFGGPGSACYAAYQEVHPLAEGHGERIELWQLQPLLVHAVLFGGSYGSAAGSAARRYA